MGLPTIAGLAFCLAFWTVTAAPSGGHGKPVCNTDTSFTFLFHNNLNASDDANHVGAILLDPMSKQNGANACAKMGESLISDQTLQNHGSDFFYSLNYLQYSEVARPSQAYYTHDGTVSLGNNIGQLLFNQPHSNAPSLPILCTQSSRGNGTSATPQSIGGLIVQSSSNIFTGFRNQKSFRFQGIPYADTPNRFEYSRLYSKTGQTIDATAFGADCAQSGNAGSSEDCLFLNIQTPYIPKHGSKTKLRPVLFSIHGGGFTGGNGGAGSGEDGGNFASREDIVSVEINYRLSTLGFLAIPGTDIKGNFGIGDQIVALKWVKQNIAQFGGDPNKITIIGESAGAGSVRALLGSPPVIHSNLIVGAVAQSNLGGGITLGLNGTYGTTYSSYYTISQSYAVAGQQIFTGVGCNQSTLSAQITCLKTIPAQSIVNLPTVARYVVQDGTLVNTEQLIVSTRNGSAAHVPIIFGVAANDGASIGSSYPPANITNEVEGISASLSISKANAQSVIDSGLFPYHNTGNLTLDTFNVSQRVATDITFRCIDEATVYAGSRSGVFPAAYYYEFDRTSGGYDPNNLGGSGLSSGPLEPGFPYGDPGKLYFRLHGSDLGFTYGNEAPLRDARDLQASQLISGYFAQFAKTGSPNVDEGYLRARGYLGQLQSVKESGPWERVSSKTGPAKALDYVSRSVEFPELRQCAWLRYPVEYYLQGGS